MQLIKEHLASKGLCKTVSAMEEELKDIDVGSKKTLTFVPLTVAATATLATPSVESKKRLREVTSLPSSASGNALAGSSSSNIHGIAASPDDVVSDSKKVKRQLSHDLESERTVPSAVSSNQSNAHTTSASNHHSAAVSVNGIVYKLPVPISKAQRKRNISRALKQSSSAVVRTTNPAMESTVLSKDRSSSSAALFSPPASHSTRHHLKTAQSTVTHTQHLQSRSNIASNSKLHNIMQRYLKLQHSQCKHPITTLPVLSLTKPHVCARPSPPQFQNISSILNYHNSMRNTWWFTHNRAEVHNSTMQYLYSSYKPIRSIRQIENASTISASSFARDNSKLWVAYYEEWQTDGPGIALLDIEQGTELSLSGLDLDGVISRFVLSPKQSKTSPFIITSLCEYLQYQNFAMDHELYLWKDTNDLEVFNAPYLRKFEVFDEQNMALPEEDRESIRFIGEVFQPSGHHLAALSKGMTASSMEQYNAMCSAHILDIETGAVLQTVKNEGTDNTYTIPSIAYVEHDENLFFMDGKLWDLRLQHVIHRFDKLSFAGNTSVHPYKYEAIIDNAVWDLRTFGLRQTVPLLEGCKVKFDAAGNVLFGYRSLDEERQEFKMNLSHAIEDNNFFHVMNTSDYSHIHTELIDKENMLLWDLDVDRDGCGYMNTLMFSNHFSESICRIFEIGKRKKTLGSGDSDDDEEEEEDGDDDWSSHGDDDDDEHDGEVEEDEDDDDMDGSSDADDDLDDDSVDDDDDGFGSDSSEEENEEGPEVGDGGLDVEDEEYDSEDDSDFEEGEEDEQDDEEGWETLSEESI